MKISKVDDAAIQAVQQYQKTEKVQEESSAKVDGSAAPEEKVNLSTKARDIQQLRDAVSQLPDVREDKISELKDQVDTGTYDVNGQKIAEKMVSESLLDTFA
ncbi:MAG: flagellar biosynthesis anti-sigma factor FlgM [Syntrophales bacterium]|jgi:negative regulator of flagellin synthesis FlgM